MLAQCRSYNKDARLVAASTKPVSSLGSLGILIQAHEQTEYVN